MKIIKFGDFIKENVHDTPEQYVNSALLKIKKKIESFFEKTEQEEVEDDDNFVTMSDALKKGKEKKSKNSKISFSDLGLTLLSSELSKYSAVFDSVKFIFEDERYRYDLYITIPLEQAIPKDKEKDFSDRDIKKCFVKFKKYDKDNNFEMSSPINKNVEIATIDDNFIVDLKIELDEDSGDSEKLEIETE